ncbi:hypothetical protein HNQ07_000959 [Deinococcus metalli]|nr:hypothetical protein [Deinococcus metalli]MBB5375515.1 hypothetical protein [Deinococcus metalli]
MSSRPPGNPLKTLPQREVTPELRRRTARTFWLILLAFVTGIGMMVAALAWQGRGASDYARSVRDAVVAGKPSPNASYSVGCGSVKAGPLPRGVTSCEVRVDGGQVGVHLVFEGGREVILNR